ncbi:hypothetical protein TpMuguga_03g00243 [Theileria parva strain Muguga]|uniref:Uncharacterized protein n=1 Tax=Theileria parva TaxID=5875 RepID=Q4N0A8_THEPA|nr:uncharacterized protein TpMuguga_03g00243 [Theileria parva strain Muguga]EAN30978.1 hypothetical protein TpMuguga_03g00243 [Theileria parva strain Muguga]|eukprot:XP_763261.1 hypothetical protein [Theileria parva strain Muguga]
MVGLRCIHGYLIIYLLYNYLKISVNSLDPNADTGEGTSNGTHLVGSAIKNDPVSQSTPATVTAEATPVSTPSTTPVTLDIDNTQSTSAFEYSKDGVFHSYDPKSGHTFSKVTQGHNVIWESKKNISGTFVRTKSENNVKYLVVLLSNNMFKLFHQSNKNNPWSDITSQKHDVTKFKFYGENDAELTLSDYKISIVDYSFCYSFKTGVKCKKVLLGQEVVWKSGDDRKFKEIKSFSLGLTSNSFFIMNPSGEVKKLFFTVTIDINITQTNDDFDYSKSYDCHKFVPKDGYLFSKVTQGTNVIWESINNVFGTLVRTKVLFDDEKYLAILLSNNLFKLFYQPDGKTWNDITDKRFDIKKLKFLGDGDDEINPATSYIITIVNYSYRYRFINGEKCKKIKYGNDVIWNHTDDFKFDSISMFYLGLLSNQFSVKNGSNGFKTLFTQISKVTLAIDKTSSTDKLYYHKTGDCHKYFSKPGYAFSKITQGSNVIWESKDNICGTNVSFIDEPNKKYLIILLDNDTFSLFHQSNGTWTDIIVGKIDVSKLKFLGESDSELNSSGYTVTLVKQLFCYSLHDGVKCLKIKYADRDIWTNTDDSKFKSITMFHFDVISNDFFVRNESGELNKIVVKFVTLDIDKKASTDEFDYSNDNEFHQYVPKSRHYFTKVSEGTTVVWESKDNLVGTKVRTKFKGNEKYVAILLSNNLFKLLQQSNGSWTDITDKRHDMTKLKFYGENDKEITTSDYKVDLVSLIAYRIIFKSGVNCKKIKYGDDDLWKHTDDPNYSTITILGLGLVTNDFFIHNSVDEYKKLEFKPTTKPITLDVNKPSSTDKFHYSKTGDCHKYVTRAGYSFNKVSQGNNVIWESKSDVCGTNVSFIDEIKNKYIAILLDNNTFSLFHQFHDTWTDITGEKYDVSKLKFLGESGTELTLSDYTVALVEYSLRFTFNSAVKCLKIKYADVDIWQHSDDTKFQLITLFHLDLISNSFFVKNEPGEFKKLNKPVIKGTPVTLDIDKKESTIEFNYSKSGNFHKYVPKLGHVFNEVVQGTTVIWQIQNGLDFGEKILLEDFDKGKRTLIMDTRSDKKMFCRLNEDPSWKEVDEKPQKAFETIEDSTGQGKTTEQEQETQSEETTHKKETTDDSAAEQPKEQLHVPTSYSYVTLDLNNNSSTGEFDYHKKNEYATYTPKSGYLFNKVIRSASSDFSKEEVFWSAQEGLEKYVKMVRLKLTDSHTALLLTTGEFLLFHKDDVDQEWKDITTSKHNFSGFKFFTFDPESYEERELDPGSYNLELHEFSYGVTFGDEVECYLIKHNDKLIYNYEQDLEFDTLKGVYLGLVSNKFFLTNFENDNKRLDLNKAVSPPKPKPEKTTEANDQSTSTATVLQELLEEDSDALIPEAKLTSLNINVSENTSNYQCSDNGIYKTFTALPGHGFNDVKVATKTFWKSHNNDYGIKVRLKESSTHEKYVVILLASKKYQLFYSSGKRKPLVDITDAKNSFYGIKLFSKSETTSVYEQLSPSSYNVYLYHLSLGYRTKESLKFHLVKLGNDVIYNCDDDQEFGVMKGAYLDLIENNIYVINMHDQRKVVKELDRGKTVTIDLNKTETTSEYEYEKKDDLVTYTSIGSGVFDKLIRSSRLGSDEIIWKARDMKEHAKKIILDGQGKRGKITNVILHLVSDDIKHLDYLDGNWIETSNKVTLNLDYTSGTDEFEYSKDGEFTTFTTKGLYLFNSLIESSSSDSSEKIGSIKGFR